MLDFQSTCRQVSCVGSRQFVEAVPIGTAPMAHPAINGESWLIGLSRRGAPCRERPQLGDRRCSFFLISNKPNKFPWWDRSGKGWPMIHHVAAVRGRNPLVVDPVFARNLGDLIWRSGKPRMRGSKADT